MKTAQGTLQTKFYTVIPILLFFSKSRITNGKFVPHADSEDTTGKVFSIHVTPFFTFGLVIPTFINRALNQK